MDEKKIERRIKNLEEFATLLLLLNLVAVAILIYAGISDRELILLLSAIGVLFGSLLTYMAIRVFCDIAINAQLTREELDYISGFLFYNANRTSTEFIETGCEIDCNYKIIEPQYKFNINEEFYVSYANQVPLGEASVSLKIVNCNTNEVVSEKFCNIEPEWDTVVEKIWIENRGRYRVIAKISGETKASTVFQIRHSESIHAG